MDTIDLDAIRERCRTLDDRLGETARAWEMEGPSLYNLYTVRDGNGNKIHDGIQEECDFIAHSRLDVPALAAEVERLKKALTSARDFIRAGKAVKLSGREFLAAELALALELEEKPVEEVGAEIERLRDIITSAAESVHAERLENQTEIERLRAKRDESKAEVEWLRVERLQASLRAILGEAQTDLDDGDLSRNIIVEKCQTALAEEEIE